MGIQNFLSNTAFILHGRKHFGSSGYLHASKTFDNSVMARRMEGQVVLVTGANQGLGFKISEELASRGCTLIMACRSKERGEEAVAQVKAASGNSDVHLKICDVSSLQSVADLARDIEASGRPLHCLVNNAGALFKERKASVDGVELSYATNTLGCFALTTLLGPVLARSAPSRVVIVASGGLYTQPLIPAPLPEGGKEYDGIQEYARDKRRLSVMAERFAELWAGKGVGVYSVHPGWTVTEGVKNALPQLFSMFGKGMRDVAQGADTIVWLCLQDKEKLEEGGFYLDRTKQDKHFALAGTKYTAKEVDALWEQLNKLAAKVLGPR